MNSIVMKLGCDNATTVRRLKLTFRNKHSREKLNFNEL
jgi:hypothetical protein